MSLAIKWRFKKKSKCVLLAIVNTVWCKYVLFSLSESKQLKVLYYIISTFLKELYHLCMYIQCVLLKLSIKICFRDRVKSTSRHTYQCHFLNVKPVKKPNLRSAQKSRPCTTNWLVHTLCSPQCLPVHSVYTCSADYTATWRHPYLSIVNQSQMSIEISALLWLVQ
jgi:hypothetical protein